MACGTPVIAYRASSLPEVVGDAGELVEPDAGALGRPWRACSAIPRCARAPRARARARRASSRWERCAEATVATYREALDG